MPQTWGIPVSEIQRGIRHGIRKINIDIDFRLAMTAIFRKVVQEDRREFDPRKFRKPAMEAMKILCRARFKDFGAAGHASSIKVTPPADMARLYRSGASTSRSPAPRPTGRLSRR